MNMHSQPIFNNLGQLSVLYYNARSILPKIEELRAVCLTCKPDIICITETWLDDSILNNELFIDNYNIIRHDRDRHGGGVMFFVINYISYNLVSSGPLDLELIVISVKLCSSKVCIALFYRPPNASGSIFDNVLTSLCTYVDVSLFSNFILLGDFNVNYLNNLHPMFCKLHCLISSLCLTQVVTEPTHYTQHSCSLIDLVYLSSPANLISCSTIPALANSDHLSLSFTVAAGCHQELPKSKPRMVWRYSHADFDGAQRLIDSTNWNEVLCSEDINICWDNWLHKFMQIMEKCIPRGFLRSRKNLPWLTKPLIKLIRKRNSLFKAAKNSKSQGAYRKLTVARNQVVALLRRNKSEFFRKLPKSNAKEFWKSIKLVNKKKSSIPSLEFNGRLVENNAEKANVLNDYFNDCFNKRVPSLADQPSHLLPQNCPEELLCDDVEVLDLISSLNVAKSTGPDGISAKMLKATAASIAPSLTRLFNLSLATGSFPEAWKMARIVPIPKTSTSSSSPSGYRPISILSIISKILEKHVHQLIFQHLCVHHPLSSKQWGFLPGRSTASALLSLTG